MTRRRVLLAGALLLGAFLLYRWKPVNRRVAWRMDLVRTYLRGVLYPADTMPTPRPVPLAASPTPTFTPAPPSPTSVLATAVPTPLPSPSPTPLPQNVTLPSPDWEPQDWNNCGPASLSMYLRFYGWDGDQFDISRLLKPAREDRNVNPEELVYYVRTRAGWLNALFRVGGDLETLKRLLAAGYPVMVEEAFYFEEPYWPKDDLWAAHYLLLTGYDDSAQTFTGQDSFYGADRTISYAELIEKWHPFNNLFLVVYPPDSEAQIQTALGDLWNMDTARQTALQRAQQETQETPQDAFAWFNLGSNLVYFERYDEAATAYDEARRIGLPQRMLRYQFGPFLAYFHSGRTEDLLALTTYALQRTPNSEEALLWHGWGLYRQGKTTQAIAHFRA
ncbi:MAG: hypothetical protein D6755_09685, partial [Anaerolineae bacterium]